MRCSVVVAQLTRDGMNPPVGWDSHVEVRQVVVSCDSDGEVFGLAWFHVWEEDSTPKGLFTDRSIIHPFVSLLEKR